ncbi:MAG TPA: type II secretion system protein [Nitrosospira sp.]|nr:type II secretion system protein [Nitrosospira sp.]
MPNGREREKGFTYIWMMFTVAAIGLTLAAAGQSWRTQAQREKEKELIFAGDQLRRAIGSYYESSPGAKRFPPSLEKLLLDDRFPFVKRHLRKVFADPLTGKFEWGLITQPGVGIMGVHSLSTGKPLKRANFHERYTDFEKAETYKDWKFIYSPGDPELATPQVQGRPVPEAPPPGGQRRGAGAQPPAPQGPSAGPAMQPGQFPGFPESNPTPDAVPDQDDSDPDSLEPGSVSSRMRDMP